MTGDGSKVQCCKEQYGIGTWTVTSMNQGKLEVFKQEMASVNINIFWISKLKWTGMGEFKSDDHYIYSFSRQEFWSGLPFPSPGDLPNPGIEPRSPALQVNSLPAEPQGKPFCLISHNFYCIFSILGVLVFTHDFNYKFPNLALPNFIHLFWLLFSVTSSFWHFNDLF